MDFFVEGVTGHDRELIGRQREPPAGTPGPGHPAPTPWCSSTASGSGPRPSAPSPPSLRRPPTRWSWSTDGATAAASTWRRPPDLDTQVDDLAAAGRRPRRDRGGRPSVVGVSGGATLAPRARPPPRPGGRSRLGRSWSTSPCVGPLAPELAARVEDGYRRTLAADPDAGRSLRRRAWSAQPPGTPSTTTRGRASPTGPRSSRPRSPQFARLRPVRRRARRRSRGHHLRRLARRPHRRRRATRPAEVLADPRRRRPRSSCPAPATCPQVDAPGRVRRPGPPSRLARPPRRP